MTTYDYIVGFTSLIALVVFIVGMVKETKKSMRELEDSFDPAKVEEKKKSHVRSKELQEV